MRVNPLFGSQYPGGFRTQYARGRCAVGINYVISYTNIKLYIKKMNLSARNTPIVIYNVKQL